MQAWRVSILLLVLGMLSCTRANQNPQTASPAAVKPFIAKDEQGNELTIPEIVRSERVQNDNRGLMWVTVGNSGGDYVLACNRKADACITPIPGKDYYVFNKTTKWKFPGAAKSVTLAWIQDWTISYLNGENIALVPAEGGQPTEVGMYWLETWTGRTSK